MIYPYSMKRAKAQIGDIFEIGTSLGLYYAQFTHAHPTHTDVLVVFEGGYDKRPDDILSVINRPVQYTVLIAVNASYKAGVIERVGNAPIREELVPFPKFRNGVANPKTLQVENWWIWDGESEICVGDLTEDQKKYPRLIIRNIAAVKSLIEGDLHPSLL